LPVVMLMHAGLSASTVIFARPGLSDAQSLASVFTWAALLWIAAGAVVLADRRQPASKMLQLEGTPGRNSLKKRIEHYGNS
jgi:hypothetical protein